MKNKLKRGICKLCNKDKILNFEHIPPRSAFNKSTRYTKTNFMEVISDPNILNRELKGKIEQGGIGEYSFCVQCNNFLGLQYVKPYKKWVMAGAYVLMQGKSSGYHFEAEEIHLNKVLKQIVSMFLAINNVHFSISNPELREYVLDPNSQILNNRFQIFCYLNIKGNVRYIPNIVKGEITTQNATLVSEITFPPFGYVLTINSIKKVRNLVINITDFKSYNPNMTSTIDIKLKNLETHLPLPLDYRTLSEIEKTIKENS